MTTELMKVVAQENLETHIAEELEEEDQKGLINPLQVWITRWENQNPGSVSLVFLYLERTMMWDQFHDGRIAECQV